MTDESVRTFGSNFCQLSPRTMRAYLIFLSLLLHTATNASSDVVIEIGREDCTICLETIWMGVNATEIIPGCSHPFHSECIRGWVQRAHDTCPTCRGNIGSYLQKYLPAQKHSYSATTSVVILVVIMSCFVFMVIQSGPISFPSPLTALTSSPSIGRILRTLMYGLLFWLYGHIVSAERQILQFRSNTRSFRR